MKLISNGDADYPSHITKKFQNIFICSLKMDYSYVMSHPVYIAVLIAEQSIFRCHWYILKTISSSWKVIKLLELPWILILGLFLLSDKENVT